MDVLIRRIFKVMEVISLWIGNFYAFKGDPARAAGCYAMACYCYMNWRFYK